MEKSNTLSIAGYCRISVDEELDRDNTSIENQKKIIEEFAKAKSKITGVVVNKDRTKGKSYYGYGYYTEDNKKPKYKKEDIPTIDFEEEKIGNKKQNNAAVTSSVVSSIVNNSK